MRNIDLFNKDNTVFSFEVFPPKTTSGLQSITSVIGDLLKLNPKYMSVTYGAGGSMQDNRTLELCKMIKDLSDIEPLAHMTCVGSTKNDIDQLVAELKKINVKNILTLRGDGGENGLTKGDFTYASSLASYINSKYGNDFCLGGACYPVG
ncbi:MAG: methylenetetrahydrofolate reductase, partial [Bacillota bacterium]